MKSESNKLAVRGELALIAMVIMNSAGVLLMLHSGSGISAISSVPYGFQQVFPQLTLGTWTYMFQGLLVLASGGALRTVSKRARRHAAGAPSPVLVLKGHQPRELL